MFFFIKKILIFSLPVSLIFVFPAIVIFLGREYISHPDVVQTQMNFPEVIFGTAYNSESFTTYKRFLVEEKKPKIIALGTSRVMQLRKEFFKEPETFVNAGGAVKTLEDIDFFIKNLPIDNKVEVIILSLDQNMFYENLTSKEGGEESVLPVRLMRLGSMSRKIYLDYMTHKFTLTELINKYDNSKNIGLIALTEGDGFRSDGSYRYNKAPYKQSRNDTVSIEIQQKINDIKQNTPEISSKQKHLFNVNLELLSNILDLCEQKNIIVIGFTPPLPEPIYQTMSNTVGLDKEMVTTVPEEVLNIFTEHDSDFYDLSSPMVFGGNETEFVDTIHGTDVMYLKIMLYMSERTDVLDKYTDSKFLRIVIQNTKQDFLSF